jgi:hypothetical protein
VVITQGFLSQQVARRIVMVTAILAGLAIGYVWATQGPVFDIGDTVAAVTELAQRLTSGA